MKNTIRSILIATMLLVGMAASVDYPGMDSNPTPSLIDKAPTVLSQTPQNLLPVIQQPVIPVVNQIQPTQTQAPTNAPKLSDIEGIPVDLQAAGVIFDGSKPDRDRYENALATNYLGEPYEITPGNYLPYFMSSGAIPYVTRDAPTKQSRNALVHGSAVYTNPDGTTTMVPLALVVGDQMAFHLWYKQTYSDPRIVLPTLG